MDKGISHVLSMSILLYGLQRPIFNSQDKEPYSFVGLKAQEKTGLLLMPTAKVTKNVSAAEGGGNVLCSILISIKTKAWLYSFRQCGVYPSFLKVGKQGRRRQLHDVQLLETRLGGRLPAKGERYGTDMRCLFLYAFQDIRNTVRCVEVCRQCDDVSALSQTEVEPLLTLGVYLERGFAFVPERGFVPEVYSLLLYRGIPQTVQIVCDSYLFCFFYCHFRTVW